MARTNLIYENLSTEAIDRIYKNLGLCEVCSATAKGCRCGNPESEAGRALIETAKEKYITVYFEKSLYGRKSMTKITVHDGVSAKSEIIKNEDARKVRKYCEAVAIETAITFSIKAYVI